MDICQGMQGQELQSKSDRKNNHDCAEVHWQNRSFACWNITQKSKKIQPLVASKIWGRGYYISFSI